MVDQKELNPHSSQVSLIGVVGDTCLGTYTSVEGVSTTHVPAPGRTRQLGQTKGFGQNRGDIGRMRDNDTDFREQVFKQWNITGLKHPAVFRP